MINQYANCSGLRGEGEDTCYISQPVFYYRNYVFGIKVITNADLPLIRGLLCYLLPNRSTYYEDFSIYIMGLSSS